MQDNVLHTLAIDVKKMIQDADGVVFSKDGKTLLACSKPLDHKYVIPKSGNPFEY